MMLAANSANQGDNKVARSGRRIWSKWGSKTRAPKQADLRWRRGVPSQYTVLILYNNNNSNNNNNI
jgi:hypothetical protein